MKGLLPKILVSCLLLVTLSSTAQIRNFTTQQAPLPCLNKEFSVVLHTVVDTFGNTNIDDPITITTAFDSLNAAFAPICASFRVCEERTIENFHFDVVDSLEQWEDLLVKHHQPNRINIFLVDNSQLDPISPAQECGFATQGGITILETGGILIHKDCLELPSNLVHLVGNYFDLLDTFEGNGEELVDGSNCASAGDLICDTPADNYVPPQPLVPTWIDEMEPCRFVNGGTDTNGTPYRPDVGNFMSYYGECRCGFSYQQYLVMTERFLSSDPKMW